MAREGVSVPDTFGAVFASLHAAGWIDAELAVRLARWAAHRDGIAYGDMRGLEYLHAALGERGDLRQLAAHVAARLAG